MSKIKFISYYKCKICKDVFNEDEILEHLTIKCKKPLPTCLTKAINNGYELNF